MSLEDYSYKETKAAFRHLIRMRRMTPHTEKLLEIWKREGALYKEAKRALIRFAYCAKNSTPLKR